MKTITLPSGKQFQCGVSKDGAYYHNLDVGSLCDEDRIFLAKKAMDGLNDIDNQSPMFKATAHGFGLT